VPRLINRSRISRPARPCENDSVTTLTAGRNFAARYAAEVDRHPEHLSRLRALARQGPITLIFSAHDEVPNDALRYGIFFWNEKQSERPRRLIDSVLEESDA
jgi:hypothetical protein